LVTLSVFRSHDYWEQTSADLAAYSTHARRNTIEPSDVACLFERYAFASATEANCLHGAHSYLDYNYSSLLGNALGNG